MKGRGRGGERGGLFFLHVKADNKLATVGGDSDVYMVGSQLGAWRKASEANSLKHLKDGLTHSILLKVS